MNNATTMTTNTEATNTAAKSRPIVGGTQYAVTVRDDQFGSSTHPMTSKNYYGVGLALSAAIDELQGAICDFRSAAPVGLRELRTAAAAVAAIADALAVLLPASEADQQA